MNEFRDKFRRATGSGNAPISRGKRSSKPLIGEDKRPLAEPVKSITKLKEKAKKLAPKFLR